MGTNKRGVRMSKKDYKKVHNSYFIKFEEYSKMSEEALMELVPTLGGTYKRAAIDALADK